MHQSPNQWLIIFQKKKMVQLPNQLSGQEVISDIKFIRIKLVPFQKKNTPIYKIEHSPHFLDSQLCLNVKKKKKKLHSKITLFPY